MRPKCLTRRRRLVYLEILMSIAALALFVGTASLAATKKPYELPKTIYWGYRYVGSAISTSAVTTTEKIGPKLGIKIRLIPGEDVEMVTMLRAGKVHFATFASDAYWASMGLVEYSTFAFGPQPIRMVWPGAPMPGASTGLATKVSGIKTPYDLKGKRLTRVVGAAWSNLGLRGSVAFGNLTYDDVTVIQVSSAGAAYKTLVEGKADFCMGSPSAPVIYEAEASAYGAYVVHYPPEDKEGWARYRKYMPFASPAWGTVGAGIKPRERVSMVAYPWPITNTLASQPNELVYAVCKAIHSKIDEIVASYEANEYMKVEHAVTPESTIMAPYHPGAIKFFKEIGVWTAAHEAANVKRLRQLEKVNKRWEAFVEEAQEKMAKTGKKVDPTKEWPVIVEKEIGLMP